MKKILIISVLLICIIIIFSLCISKNNDSIELTQLSSQTNDRMMGYVIRTSKEKTIVIDGGMPTDADNLIKNIKKYGNKIDYWFITHPHRDHAGAFIQMMENTTHDDNNNIEIGKLYYTANEIEWYEKYASDRAIEVKNFYTALENEKVKNIKEEPQIGDVIKIDDIKIEILGIKNPEITQNAINNSSMVFKLKNKDTIILFLGDIGKETSEKLINKYGSDLKSDVVQMAHHGQAGATEELYKLVNPKVCLWPTPLWLWNNDSGQGYNSGQWKTLETRKWMENLNVIENYVAKDGDITINIK